MALGDDDTARKATTHRALDGIRVIDLTQFEAGTTCTETLAWLGADVIKVERPGTGEQGRAANRENPDRDSFYFILLNANKRSVTLNLQTARGKEIFRDMLRQADVLVENFGPGSMERLGFGPGEVDAINPRIIYARIKGFATGSPFEDFLVFDAVAQAIGGSTAVTGESMERRPVKPGPNLADTGSGIHCAVGILAALYDRKSSGVGQVVEIAMQDAVINFCRILYAQAFRTGRPAERTGAKGQLKSSAPSGLYPCKPGGPNDFVHIYGSRNNDAGNAQWNRLLGVIGRAELIGDPRFETPEMRYKHNDLIDEAISSWTMQHAKQEVMERLGAVKVPVGAVLDTDELRNDAFLREHKMFVTIDHPAWGSLVIPGSPIRLSRSPVDVQPAPLLGQHNGEVYQELLDLEESQVADLAREGII
jgi:formyl-CoA transferase